ncbi:MAG: CocE/NonD family hydrolase [Alistipes sp.]|nr:CocE/NonD family hydrolase [Alistipes sp.]
MRGYGKSLGNKDATNGANDAFDTAEWLYRKARKNNGKIGVWGFGEDAKYAIETAMCSHQAIKAVSVQAPVKCEVAVAKLSTPTLFVGGMFDEQSNNLWNSYRTAKTSNPAVDIRLVVGPWAYGAWRENDAEIIANDATPEFYRTEIEFPFFDHYLRGGESSGASASGSLIYYSGENCWREGDGWQSEGEELTLYFNEEGALYEELPYQDISYSDFVSDPQNPVPATKEGAEEAMSVLLSDQSFADGRADVLTFVTPVLDSDITAAGAITTKLYVKSSQPTIDLVVKVIDVADNGESEILLRSGIVKGQNIEPNSIVPITISMTDLAHTFMAGHRLKLQIHSTWSPILQGTTTNHITLYHDKQHPSQVTIIQ